jgi:hypothetical protein
MPTYTTKEIHQIEIVRFVGVQGRSSSVIKLIRELTLPATVSIHEGLRLEGSNGITLGPFLRCVYNYEENRWKLTAYASMAENDDMLVKWLDAAEEQGWTIEKKA